MLPPLAALLGRSRVPALGLTEAFAREVWTRLDRAARLRGSSLGPPRRWQLSQLRLMLANPRSSIQGARQGAGKTHVAALLLCCALLAGQCCAVAMPTLRQGRGILASRTLEFMAALEPELALKRLRSSGEESRWDNGARLVTLSAGDMGLRGTQGWTVATLVLDESHELAYRDLGYFTPLVSIALKQRRGRLVLLGVGGRPDSAAELAPQRGFAALKLDDATIIGLDEGQSPKAKGQKNSQEWETLDACATDTVIEGNMVPRPDREGLGPELRQTAEPEGVPPEGEAEDQTEMSWREVFAEAAATLAPEVYRQFYQCLPPLAGSRRIFEMVPGPVAPSPDPGFVPQYFLGVDVGRQRDQTALAVIERRGGVANLVELVMLPLGTPYTQQAAQLGALARLWPPAPGGFCVEVNGPGLALYDILAESAHGVWHVAPVPMTAERKQQQIWSLQRDMRRGVFGVGEIALGRGMESVLGGVGQAALAVVGEGLAPSRSHAAGMAELRGNADPDSPWLSGGRVQDTPLRAVPPGVATVREHLAALSFDVDLDGRIRWEHSDVLSALLVARCGMG